MRKIPSDNQRVEEFYPKVQEVQQRIIEIKEKIN